MTPIFLHGKMPWTEAPGGYSPWGCKELDTTEMVQHWILLFFLIYAATLEFLIIFVNICSETSDTFLFRQKEMDYRKY